MSQEWRLKAACRDVDPELPFASDGTVAQDRFIREYCRVCPVRGECLEFALVDDEVGVYGGLTHRQRVLV